MAKTRTKIQSARVGSLIVTDTLTVGGSTNLGTVSWTGAQTFNGAVTFSTATTHNGPATFNSTSTFNGPVSITSTTTHSGKFILSNADVPTTFTAAGVAGQIVFRPSNAAIYVCLSTNSWYAVALSNTTAFN